MTTARKLKISVSLDAELVAAVDRAAAKSGETRSALLERWLRQSQRRSLATRLEEETAAYYDSLTPSETAEDEGWAAFASQAARRIDVDSGGQAGRPHRAKRPRKA